MQTNAVPETREVDEVWRMRNGKLAVMAERCGDTVVGHIFGTDQVYVWRAGKVTSGPKGYDLWEQVT